MDSSDDDIFVFTHEPNRLRAMRRKLIQKYGIDIIGLSIGTIQDGFISSSSSLNRHPREMFRLREFEKLKKKPIQCGDISSSTDD